MNTNVNIYIVFISLLNVSVRVSRHVRRVGRGLGSVGHVCVVCRVRVVGGRGGRGRVRAARAPAPTAAARYPARAHTYTYTLLHYTYALSPLMSLLHCVNFN